MDASTSPDRLNVVIVDGGVAGLEALMALHDLGEDRLDLTLVAADADLGRPMVAHETGDPDPEPPWCPLEVEVALPHEWHPNAMARDPYGQKGIPEGVATR